MKLASPGTDGRDHAGRRILRIQAAKSAAIAVAALLAGCAEQQAKVFYGTAGPPYQEVWQSAGPISQMTRCMIGALDREFIAEGVQHEALTMVQNRIYEVRPRQPKPATGDPYFVRVSQLTDQTLRIEMMSMEPEAAPLTGRVLRAVDRCR